MRSPAPPLERQHHLEQRVPAQGPVRPEDLDQPLERQILMRIRPQSRLPGPGDEFAERGVTGGVEAHHQGVDEEADQLVQPLVGAAGDGRTERDVRACAQSAQQGRQRRLHHHVQAGVRPHGQLGQPPVQLRTHVERDVAALVAGRGGALPVHRQPQLVRQPVQRLAPVLDLLADQGFRVVLAAEQLLLPQGVVRVLDRQFRPVGGPAGAAGLVGRGEITGEGGHRPAVRGDVMNHQGQHVLTVGQREQTRPDRYLRLQVESPTGQLGEGAVELLRCGLGDGHLRAGRARVEDPLVGHVVTADEHRAQWLVPVDEVLQRRDECGPVELTRQPEHGRHVVGGVRPFQPVEVPQSLLCVRKRDHRISSGCAGADLPWRLRCVDLPCKARDGTGRNGTANPAGRASVGG
jgi:hypothetical protein